GLLPTSEKGIPLADTCRLLGVGHRGVVRREGELGDECCGKRFCAGGGFVRVASELSIRVIAGDC
ncbi:MAG: hypothetical protein M3P52_12735, partial [Actinomycetota bacterium]|nr:hypothetical protein [Actinomycetota bacterium]